MKGRPHGCFPSMHRNDLEKKRSDTHNIIYYNKPSLGEYKPIRFSSKRFRNFSYLFVMGVYMLYTNILIYIIHSYNTCKINRHVFGYWNCFGVCVIDSPWYVRDKRVKDLLDISQGSARQHFSSYKCNYALTIR